MWTDITSDIADLTSDKFGLQYKMWYLLVKYHVVLLRNVMFIKKNHHIGKNI